MSSATPNPDSPRPAAPLALAAMPLFGSNTPAGSGWIPYVVTVTNLSEDTLSGSLALESAESPRPEQAATGYAHVYSKTNLRVEGGATVHVELLAHDVSSSGLRVRAVDDAGTLLAESTVTATAPLEPLLVDLAEPSLISAALKARPLLTEYVPAPYGRFATPSVATASLTRDKANRAVLPLEAASYASATLVLLRSSDLAALSSDNLAALGGWLLAGGSVAITIDRVEDLRSALLQNLVGGPFDEQSTSEDLGSTFTVPSPSDSDKGRHSPETSISVAPSAEVKLDLVSYGGGNLRPSPWGSSATYGLGEVHLLAFDPNANRNVSDRWVQLKMLSLLTYAWDRNAQLVFPVGSVTLEDSGSDEVKRVLDPNEGKLWLIAVAGIILIAYALWAGPFAFYLARKSGHPVRALIRLPLSALLVSVLIATIGTTTKGGRGRSRRLALIEAGAGMPQGATVRYRAFFAASSDTLTIPETLSRSLLDVVGPRGRSRDSARLLMIDKEESHLVHVRNKPWQTVLVREDGIVPIGNGLSIRAEHESVALKNLTGRDLIGVLLHLPGGDLRFFPRVVDGQRVLASDGELLKVGSGSSARTLHGLASEAYRHKLDRAASGTTAAWLALAKAGRREVDWFPADVPVVMAQLDEPRVLHDAGFPLDQNRILIRVVGFGGTL